MKRDTSVGMSMMQLHDVPDDCAGRPLKRRQLLSAVFCVLPKADCRRRSGDLKPGQIVKCSVCVSLCDRKDLKSRHADAEIQRMGRLKMKR